VRFGERHVSSVLRREVVSKDVLDERAILLLLEPGEADRDLIQLLAELDARADAEGIDEATTKELLLNLHERKLRRELQNADFERTKELQEELERLRSATTNLV